MIVLGLTGSIGMGKSTASSMLRRMGVPVHDSDAAVHDLIAPSGGAVEAIADLFPAARHAAGGIDRQVLGQAVFGDAAARRRLEAVLHPLVVDSQRRFLERQGRRRMPLAVLDIPLLFETGAERRVDHIILLTAPYFVQRARVLARGMSERQFQARLAAQMPDGEKRRRADFIVQTGLGFHYTLTELRRIVAALTATAQ